MLWGTHPIQIEFADDPDTTIRSAEKFLRQNKLIVPGNHLVVISDMRMGQALIDCIQLRVVK
jgi:hypothetical protein